MRQSAYALVLLLTALVTAYSLANSAWRNHQSYTRQVGQLVALSERNAGLFDSHNLKFDQDDIQSAMRWIRAHPDCSSIHLLMVLRRDYQEAYNLLVDNTKAAILVAYLRRTSC